MLRAVPKSLTFYQHLRSTDPIYSGHWGVLSIIALLLGLSACSVNSSSSTGDKVGSGNLPKQLEPLILEERFSRWLLNERRGDDSHEVVLTIDDGPYGCSSCDHADQLEEHYFTQDLLRDELNVKAMLFYTSGQLPKELPAELTKRDFGPDDARTLNKLLAQVQVDPDSIQLKRYRDAAQGHVVGLHSDQHIVSGMSIDERLKQLGGKEKGTGKRILPPFVDLVALPASIIAKHLLPTKDTTNTPNKTSPVQFRPVLRMPGNQWEESTYNYFRERKALLNELDALKGNSTAFLAPFSWDIPHPEGKQDFTCINEEKEKMKIVGMANATQCQAIASTCVKLYTEEYANRGYGVIMMHRNECSNAMARAIVNGLREEGAHFVHPDCAIGGPLCEHVEETDPTALNPD